MSSRDDFLGFDGSMLIFGPSVGRCLKLQTKPQIKLEVVGLHSVMEKERLTLLKLLLFKLSFLPQEDQSISQ